MINITTVDYYLQDESVHNIFIDANETILDADVVIFSPYVYKNLWSNDARSQDDNSDYVFSPKSDQIREIFEKRRNEVETLLDNGKIIITILDPVVNFRGQIKGYNDSDIISNYDFLPHYQETIINKLKPGTSGNRKSIKHNKKNTIFSPIFYAFENNIQYQAYFDLDGKDKKEYFILNRANRPVAAIHSVLNGLIVYLPSFNGDTDEKKLLGVIRQCSQKFFKKEIITPKPEWISNYELKGEREKNEKIEFYNNEIEKLKSEKIKIENERNNLIQFKGLLYEQGNLLEDLVLKSFELFGFSVENRKIDDIEHDLIFWSEEGRGIAEIEGKNKDAINISKLDQLNRAVDEDFDLTNNYPQGILIGNHYRLIEPSIRESAFTEKVHIVAKKKSFGLLTTLEIYKAVEYLLDNPSDENFKFKCRKKILETTGQEIKFDN